jgi:hypothetical protein
MLVKHLDGSVTGSRLLKVVAQRGELARCICASVTRCRVSTMVLPLWLHQIICPVRTMPSESLPMPSVKTKNLKSPSAATKSPFGGPSRNSISKVVEPFPPLRPDATIFFAIAVLLPAGTILVASLFERLRPCDKFIGGASWRVSVCVSRCMEVGRSPRWKEATVRKLFRC